MNCDQPLSFPQEFDLPKRTSCIEFNCSGGHQSHITKELLFPSARQHMLNIGLQLVVQLSVLFGAPNLRPIPLQQAGPTTVLLHSKTPLIHLATAEISRP